MALRDPRAARAVSSGLEQLHRGRLRRHHVAAGRPAADRAAGAGVRPVAAPAPGGARDRPPPDRHRRALHADPPAGRVPPGAVLHRGPAVGQRVRPTARLGFRAVPAGPVLAGRDRPRLGQPDHLPAAVRRGRLLLPSRPASLRLALVAARGAPQPAPDDDLERRPQPSAGRHAARRGRGVRVAAGGRAAGAVRGGGGDHPAGAELLARQSAPAFRRHR